MTNKYWAIYVKHGAAITQRDNNKYKGDHKDTEANIHSVGLNAKWSRISTINKSQVPQGFI